MDKIENWVEPSPYSRFLGIRLEGLDESSARLRLPYQDANSNPGKVLHGGCAASIGAIAGQAIARAALGEEAGPFHTAPKGDLVAYGRCVQNDNEIYGSDVEVASAVDGRVNARGTVLYRIVKSARPPSARPPES